MGEGGGVQNGPKKCHVLFEWPLKPNFESFLSKSISKVALKSFKFVEKGPNQVVKT